MGQEQGGLLAALHQGVEVGEGGEEDADGDGHAAVGAHDGEVVMGPGEGQGDQVQGQRLLPEGGLAS